MQGRLAYRGSWPGELSITTRQKALQYAKTAYDHLLRFLVGGDELPLENADVVRHPLPPLLDNQRQTHSVRLNVHGTLFNLESGELQSVEDCDALAAQLNAADVVVDVLHSGQVEFLPTAELIERACTQFPELTPSQVYDALNTLMTQDYITYARTLSTRMPNLGEGRVGDGDFAGIVEKAPRIAAYLEANIPLYDNWVPADLRVRENLRPEQEFEPQEEREQCHLPLTLKLGREADCTMTRNGISSKVLSVVISVLLETQLLVARTMIIRYTVPDGRVYLFKQRRVENPAQDSDETFSISVIIVEFFLKLILAKCIFPKL